MIQFADISSFVQQASRVSRPAELQTLLDEMTRALDFDYFSLVHHVDMNTLPASAVFLTTFPSEWLKVWMERRFYIDGPIINTCERTAVGFCWSEASAVIDLTPRHHMILDQAKAHGIEDAFTVPIHVPGDFSGSCSFAVSSGRALPRASFPSAQYIGCFAFEAARRIAAKAMGARPKPDEAPHLTDRQYDCVLLAARGFSERESARMLDVKPDTVHKHLEEAKRRYGASCKTQLIVKVLFNSQLSFNDILHQA